jgi:hypothetical protein
MIPAAVGGETQILYNLVEKKRAKAGGGTMVQSPRGIRYWSGCSKSQGALNDGRAPFEFERKYWNVSIAREPRVRVRKV